MEAMDLYGPNGGMALLADFGGWAIGPCLMEETGNIFS